jgi:hypothetical protein
MLPQTLIQKEKGAGGRFPKNPHAHEPGQPSINGKRTGTFTDYVRIPSGKYIISLKPPRL